MPFTGKQQRDLSQVVPIDWARLAAYIDGEGCISIKGVKGFHASSRRVMYVDLTIANTDLRLTYWLQLIFGGSVYIESRKKTSEKWSPCAKWNVSSKYAAAILENCLPFFVIKREQAATALAFQATLLPGRPYGVKGRPAELIAKQTAFKERLTDLKGTSGRRRDRVPTHTTVQ